MGAMHDRFRTLFVELMNGTPLLDVMSTLESFILAFTCSAAYERCQLQLWCYRFENSILVVYFQLVILHSVAVTLCAVATHRDGSVEIGLLGEEQQRSPVVVNVTRFKVCYRISLSLVVTYICSLNIQKGVYIIAFSPENVDTALR
jgi:hypothetical protein